MAPFNGAPGDLIEISRMRFKHWAVYIGGNEVVHLVTNGYNTSVTLSNLFTKYRKVKRHRDNYRVNNLLDDKFTPREPSVIVKAALDMVGEVISYDIAAYNCEHFATEMRYGKAESRQFNGAPGDLIAISRVGFKHWAVYIGGNEVVHLVTNGYNTSGTSSNPFTNYGKVKRHSLATAVDKDNYCVNNLLDDKLTPRKPSVIVKAALDMVGQVISYDIAAYNCEHFATEMRYGKAESQQAKAGVITYLAVTSLTAVGTLAMVTPVGAVVAAGAAVTWSVAAFKSLFSRNPTARKKKITKHWKQ